MIQNPKFLSYLQQFSVAIVEFSLKKFFPRNWNSLDERTKRKQTLEVIAIFIKAAFEYWGHRPYLTCSSRCKNILEVILTFFFRWWLIDLCSMYGVVECFKCEILSFLKIKLYLLWNFAFRIHSSCSTNIRIALKTFNFNKFRKAWKILNLI